MNSGCPSFSECTLPRETCEFQPTVIHEIDGAVGQVAPNIRWNGVDDIAESPALGRVTIETVDQEPQSKHSDRHYREVFAAPPRRSRQYFQVVGRRNHQCE